jgi:outer membrane protein
MNRKFASIYLGAIAIAATSPAWAQDAAPTANWAIGAAAVSSASPYRSYNQTVWPIPVVNYDGSDFYLTGLDGGFYLSKQSDYDLSIDASIATNYFDPSDTSNPQLKKLKTRDPSLMTGVRYRHRADWGQVQVNISQDVAGNSKGQIAQVEYAYPMVRGALTLIPSVGDSWASSTFSDYYFGVSSSDAARSGLSYYHPDASWSPYVKLIASYRISTNWSAFAQVRYTHLSNAISDSPMVDTHGLTTYLVGVLYHF